MAGRNNARYFLLYPAHFELLAPDPSYGAALGTRRVMMTLHQPVLDVSQLMFCLPSHQDDVTSRPRVPEVPRSGKLVAGHAVSYLTFFTNSRTFDT